MLAGSIVGTLLVMLTWLSVLMIVDNRRCITSEATAIWHRLAHGAGVRRRWLRSRAARNTARILAFRNRLPQVQLRLRMKTDAIILGARPGTLRPARPARDSATDLRFAGRLEDLAGLYVSPPEHALVWSCDASRQLHAVTRVRPALDGMQETPSAVRHQLLGSTPLSDALSDLSASVIGSCDSRQRHGAWLGFLRRLDRQTPPGRLLRVMCDNQATQDHPDVRKWLAAHRRVHVQMVASSGGGLRMIKRFFDSVIAEQLGVGAFRCVAELTAAIASHVGARLAEAAPFIWIRKPQGPAAAAFASPIFEVKR